MTFYPSHKKNDDLMFQTLYDSYKKRVYGIVAQKIKEKDDVLDIMQNIFFHLWIYKESLTPSNTEGIIIKTCKQEISNFVSRQKKHPYSHHDHASDLQIVDDSDAAFEAQLQKEAQITVLKLGIELLPASTKQIFTMNKLEGITQQKIADHLDMSRKAVQKQVSKALLFLKKNQHKDS